ncbi:MAG: ornithine carbamoyltransferase, partial [Gemmatimonadota bacterium]
MTVRHFLSIPDFEADDLTALLDRAGRLKRGEDRSTLTGKSLAMIFRKSSTRTRVSFEVGMTQLGGHALFLSDRDSQIGRGEPIPDTARVLSGYVDGIMIRTFAQAEVDEMARYASVPVINALTDLLHPCQIMADLQTVIEEFGPELTERRIAWIGDGNNMANSWINAAWRLGFELRLACPEGYDP